MQPREGGRRPRAITHAVRRAHWVRAGVRHDSPAPAERRPRAVSEQPGDTREPRQQPGMEACCAITAAEDVVGDQVQARAPVTEC